MNNIDITKIAVKFDPENTTEELFNAVVGKFNVAGYIACTDGDVEFESLYEFNFVVADGYGDLVMCNTQWTGLKVYNYTVLSPQEFLALEDDSQKKPPVDQPVVDTNIILAEWLDKFQYVFCNDNTITGVDFLKMIIETDHGDVCGPEDIAKFVNRRYNQLKSERKAKEKKDLEDKRQKLMAELSEIDQQLGLYD